MLTGGNFHGQPLALALDFLAMALAQVASFSERRIYSLVEPARLGYRRARAHAVPDAEPGLNSGYMIAQYVAAALVNEIKVLAHPASIDSIPTSAGMEDFVSMGVDGGHQAAAVAALACRVIAIELLCAAQGLEFRRPLLPGKGVAGRTPPCAPIVPALTNDRPPSPDIEALAEALHAGLLDALAPDEEIVEMVQEPT